jgi:hypothetical protein
MRTILLATIWALGIGFAAMTLPAATRSVGQAPGTGAAGIDAAAAYSHADVLEPGSRGSVVEI